MHVVVVYVIFFAICTSFLHFLLTLLMQSVTASLSYCML